MQNKTLFYNFADSVKYMQTFDLITKVLVLSIKCFINIHSVEFRKKISKK